jgi:hypothetical protein
MPSRDFGCSGKYVYSSGTNQWFYRTTPQFGYTGDNLIGPDVLGTGVFSRGVIDWNSYAIFRINPDTTDELWLFGNKAGSGNYWFDRYGTTVVVDKRPRWTYISPNYYDPTFSTEKIIVYYSFSRRKFICELYVCYGPDCVISDSESSESSLTEFISESSESLSSVSIVSDISSSNSSGSSSQEPIGYSTSSSTSSTSSESSSTLSSASSESSQSVPSGSFILYGVYESEETDFRNLGDYRGYDGLGPVQDYATNLRITWVHSTVGEVVIPNLPLMAWCFSMADYSSSSESSSFNTSSSSNSTDSSSSTGSS